MKFTLIFILSMVLIFSSNKINISLYHSGLQAFQNLIRSSQFKDTCVLQGFVFEIEESVTPNPLKANVKNGRIHISDLQGNELKFRVIRYVFSVRSNDMVSSVRTYSDLISYPVLQILKDAQIDEPYYFEEIIIVDQNKEILNNAVRPIIIKRVKK